MNLLKVLCVFACLVAVFNVQPAHAQVVFPDRIAFDAAFPGATHENWDTYANDTVIPNGSTLNGITYNTNSLKSAIVTNDYPTTTPPNGLGETGAGFFTSADTIKFSFPSPLSAFGIDINTGSKKIGAYTADLSNGDQIPSFFDPFPGSGTGEFIGISDPTPFSSVTITNHSAFHDTLDTLRYVGAVVPEPSTIALIIVGLMGIAALTLRRRIIS